MRKLWMILIVLCMSVLLLSACSDDKDKPSEEKSNDQVETESKENEKTEDNPEEVEEVADQLDLAVGDTGVFDTTLGTYEITLDEAELKGKKFEGVESTRDDIILLDLTIENTGDDALNAGDVIDSLEVADDLEGAGSGNSGIGFDSIDPIEGKVEPGEEMSGHFLTTVNESDTYYFRENPETAESSSNEVIWTIEKEGLKEEE